MGDIFQVHLTSLFFHTFSVQAHGSHPRCCLCVASIQRMLQLLEDLPLQPPFFLLACLTSYWQTVHSFCIAGREDKSTLTVQDAQMLLENMNYMDKQAFNSDKVLMSEIFQIPRQGSDAPLGIVLISSKEICCQCGSKLYLRSDRPCTITISYDDNLGTVPGTHYTKYCQKRNCSKQEHYGYSTQGDSGAMIYDSEWSSLPYFLSSRETAMSMEMLRRLDKEILIGQISYKQRADIQFSPWQT